MNLCSGSGRRPAAVLDRADADAAFVQEAYEVELTRAGRAPEVIQVTSDDQVLVPGQPPR